jgi:uncharacterized protein YbcC (UPF0753/DUF2309 family)
MSTAALLIDPTTATDTPTPTPAAPERVSTAPEDLAFAQRVEAACAQACGAIAPVWPLDRAIAVNPHWQRVGRPVREVAARMALLGGIRVFPPRSLVREAWREGRIHALDLTEAITAVPEAHAAGWTPSRCLDALSAPVDLPVLPLLIDVLDDDPQRPTRLSWRDAITHQVSQTCAAWFDGHQADWTPPHQDGLYAFWRDTLHHDHGIGLLMGLPRLHEALRALPRTREAAERWVLQRLGLPEAVWADYLEAVLLTVQGWASWCAYQGWQARQAGREDASLRDLLAIRLAWGAVLLDAKGELAGHQAFDALRAAWAEAPRRLDAARHALCVDEVWQVALERGYQRDLAARLAPAAGVPAPTPTPEVQAFFCIDVRSERLRRALEAVDPGVRTGGFAGFFGLPVAYEPLAGAITRPQLPGLLAPAMAVRDVIDPGHPDRPDGVAPVPADSLQGQAERAREARFELRAGWEAATRWPGTAYAFVETLGVGALGGLAGWLRPSTAARSRDDQAGLPARYRPLCRPALQGLDTEARVALAARVLGAMGLREGAAPLVLLVGHGSQSANNAQAAALDCGACCGQTGEVNARTLARLLNDPQVRLGLPAAGVRLPASTVFVAALHNTTTDEIEGFDLDLVPTASRARWERLQASLAHAGDQVRRERAPTLGLDPRLSFERLLTRLRQRANDGAQTRPEWGLAGNAAFVIAPRHRTAGVHLGGRAFLHDYDAAQDADGALLELLMTAPMLVTHWINWQYHASTCDPQRLGSGNKVLHNVVGGHLGLFEGNGGDLRIGLSRQSVHDGERWMHEPLRLTVVIDAPHERIEGIIAKHAIVRQLVENGWLHLWRLDGELIARRTRHGWEPVHPVMS